MAVKDLIIIGAGPAGITAAVYAARKKLDFTVVSMNVGGQTAWAGEVGNYPSYQYIPGPELALKFREHLEKFSFEMIEGKSVTKVEQAGKDFKVLGANNEPLVSRTLIVASGKRPRLLNVPGEGKFNNKGLTYCATCEGPLFANKNVAIIGGGNSGLDAALQMMRIAAKVYLIEQSKAIPGDPIMLDKLKNAANVEILTNTKVLEILGDQFVKAIKVESKGEVQGLPVEGIFVEIGLVPNSGFIDLCDKNKTGEIIVNCAAETSVPGLFAAGDVTNVPQKQIVIAAGEGAKACLSAFHYLSTH